MSDDAMPRFMQTMVFAVIALLASSAVIERWDITNRYLDGIERRLILMEARR